MKAIHIQWDVDEVEDLEYLPAEVEISNDIDGDEIGDYLSDFTGFCHKGFLITD